MFQFGIGGMFAKANGGNLATTVAQIQQFGTIQDVDVEFSQKLVSLYGQNKFPDDVAPSDMKLSGKAKFAFLDIDIYNQLYFAETISTGQKIMQPNEVEAIPATPYQITIVPPASGVFNEDLGVYAADFSFKYTKVASSPATTQYSVNETTGVYTFAAADTLLSVAISYVYTVTTGKTMTVTNHIQGYGPKFELWLAEPYQGNNGLHIYSARAGKMSNPLKRDGYVISDFEFEGFANQAKKVFDWFQATF